MAHPARPVSLTGLRARIPFAGERTWASQSALVLPVGDCVTLGRISKRHLYSKDGDCLRCGKYEESADQPLGAIGPQKL